MTQLAYMKGKTRDQLAAGISAILADTFMLYYKTHVCHWNVEGARFIELHALFEEQYKEILAASDEIAERVRALSAVVPYPLKGMIARGRIGDLDVKKLNATQMIQTLLDDHELLVTHLHAVRELASEAEDVATEDLMIERLRVHEKMAWMLRALLAK